MAKMDRIEKERELLKNASKEKLIDVISEIDKDNFEEIAKWEVDEEVKIKTYLMVKNRMMLDRWLIEALKDD